MLGQGRLAIRSGRATLWRALSTGTGIEFVPLKETKLSTLHEMQVLGCAQHAERRFIGTKLTTSAPPLLKPNTAENGWSWITYKQFDAFVNSFRGALHQAGVGRGDKVGTTTLARAADPREEADGKLCTLLQVSIISNNRLEWAIGAYAAFGLSAVVVPMYEAQHAHEWEYILVSQPTHPPHQPTL